MSYSDSSPQRTEVMYGEDKVIEQVLHFVSNASSQEIQHQTKLFEMLRNKPFWIWDIKNHKEEDIRKKGDCCFNHIIGLPTKERIEKPIFDYQQILYDALHIPGFSNPLNHNFKHKHIWVKKATGLGITEFFLRLMAWLCLPVTYLN